MAYVIVFNMKSTLRDYLKLIIVILVVIMGCKKQGSNGLLDNAIIGKWGVQSVYFKEVINGELEEEGFQVSA